MSCSTDGSLARRPSASAPSTASNVGRSSKASTTACASDTASSHDASLSPRVSSPTRGPSAGARARHRTPRRGTRSLVWPPPRPARSREHRPRDRLERHGAGSDDRGRLTDQRFALHGPTRIPDLARLCRLRLTQREVRRENVEIVEIGHIVPAAPVALLPASNAATGTRSRRPGVVVRVPPPSRSCAGGVLDCADGVGRPPPWVGSRAWPRGELCWCAGPVCGCVVGAGRLRVQEGGAAAWHTDTDTDRDHGLADGDGLVSGDCERAVGGSAGAPAVAAAVSRG